MMAVPLEELYKLEVLEKKDEVKEGIKFDYPDIIQRLDCNTLAQVLMKCGIRFIRIKLTTEEKKELFEKYIPKISKPVKYLGKKEIINTTYGRILTKDIYDFYACEFETKTCNYNDYKEKQKYSTINLEEISQLNPQSRGYWKVSDALIYEFVQYLNNSISVSDGASYKMRYKKIKKSLDSLFHLNELEEHIKIIIDKIKKSNLRNYTEVYKPDSFGKELIFKAYRGSEPCNLLRNEIVTINFFRRSLHSRKTLFPFIYCHGQLGDFHILIMEKIEGVTLDRYIKNLENEKRRQVVDALLYDLIKIGVDGRVKNLPTLHGKLTERKIYDWLKKGIIKKLKTEKTIRAVQKIKDNYSKINELLLTPPFFYNKDSPTGNWLVRNEFLGVIDFENTHFGPIQLDLVTLFEGKNNIELEENELIRILKEIPAKVNRYTSENNKNFPILNEDDFIKTYFAASIHRNLSMAGTSREHKNPNQMVKHLKKAEYSTKKLQNLIEDEDEKGSLQNLCNIIRDIRFNLLQ